MSILEACVGSFKEAVIAEKKGAHRIELCDNLLEGGTTPSYGTIKKTVETLNIPVMVIIRPRGGDFVYSEEEVDIMKSDIEICKELGAKGVVIGALDGKEIDKNVLAELINAAKPMDITFHMAFDLIEDKYKAIDILESYGVNRILTTGGYENALEGKESLRNLIEYSKDKIIVMPGKGITKENREEIVNYTKAKEVHGTKIV